MATYPNQKVIHITKEKCVKDFLQVNNQEWLNAQRELTPSAFIMYLYLASNANGYDLALSQKAFEEATGIKKTAYHSAVKMLIDKGYIRLKQGNVFIFFTQPVRECEIVNDRVVRKNEQSCSEKRYNVFVKTNKVVRKCDREIDKHIIKDKTDSPANTLKKKEPAIQSQDEYIAEMKQRFAAHNLL